MASGELHLKDIMYTLGIVDVFTDRADLTGITGQPQHRLSGVSKGGTWLVVGKDQMNKCQVPGPTVA